VQHHQARRYRAFLQQVRRAVREGIAPPRLAGHSIPSWVLGAVPRPTILRFSERNPLPKGGVLPVKEVGHHLVSLSFAPPFVAASIFLQLLAGSCSASSRRYLRRFSRSGPGPFMPLAVSVLVTVSAYLRFLSLYLSI
jgi:hypothetical protein